MVVFLRLIEQRFRVRFAVHAFSSAAVNTRRALSLLVFLPPHHSSITEARHSYQRLATVLGPDPVSYLPHDDPSRRPKPTRVPTQVASRVRRVLRLDQAPIATHY